MKDIDAKGRFVRQTSSFRDWIEPNNDADFPAAADRYHLYVSFACPWAHRTIIMRSLKGLEDIVSLSSVDTILDMPGWSFGKEGDATVDPINNVDYLLDIYLQADSDYQANATVPVLWDKQRQTIVNNESAEVMRMLDLAFNHYAKNNTIYYPESLHAEIDKINDYVYTNINNGVYKAGMAQTAEAHNEAKDNLFQALDKIDQDLQGKTYLVGDQLTEADIRLFTTLLRFDPVYYDLFRCNKQKLADYKNLSVYLERLKAIPEIAKTIRMDIIKEHYYNSPKLLAKLGEL